MRASDVSISDAEKERLWRSLLTWFDAHKRDLPWRRTRDPWAIWVSEIMLQQTRVATVIPYYERFLTRFPTPASLAKEPEDSVFALWSGLGYYRRARMLREGAKVVAATGKVPETRDELRQLPGIGNYTSGAIASIAFGEPVGLVDGNVARVYARLFALTDDMRRDGLRRTEQLADALVPAERPGDFNQALMELGATVCSPKSPTCVECPLRDMCEAYRQNRVADYPVLGEKKAPTAVTLQALLAQSNNGEWLLGRRRKDGLFAGLWEPPLFEGDRSSADTWAKRLGATNTDYQRSFAHVLTHRRLTVEVHAVVLDTLPAKRLLRDTPYDAWQWVSPAELRSRGISTLAKKLLSPRAT